jgi:hypothetical protein
MDRLFGAVKFFISRSIFAAALLRASLLTLPDSAGLPIACAP